MSTFFNFTTALADVDETTPGHPYHPAVLLVVDLGEEFDQGEQLAIIYVIVPADVLGNLRPQLRAGVGVKVKGTVEDVQGGSVHLAYSLELAPGADQALNGTTA